jgi:DNA-binding ferritin-like protein
MPTKSIILKKQIKLTKNNNETNSLKYTKLSNNRKDLEKFGKDIILIYFEILNTVKLFHWKTYSYSTHKATDQLYSELNELIDEFVEVMLGKMSVRVNLTSVKSLQLNDYKNNNELIKKIKDFQKYLINLNKYLDNHLDSDLLNIRDEILGKLNQFLYLLTLK